MAPLGLTLEPDLISAGAFHACAAEGTTMHCWGSNEHGALGLGNTTDIGDDEPVTDAHLVGVGFHRILAIEAGYGLTCALTADDRLRCWGNGAFLVPHFGVAGPDVGDDEIPAAGPTIPIDGLADATSVFGGGTSVGDGLAHGDFNGDGYDDLAIGAPGAPTRGQPGAGEVRVRFGSGTGLPFTGGQTWTQARAGVADFPEADDGFGHVLTAGDFNGDGYDDLAVAAPGERHQGVFLTGIVHVFPGSATGLRASGSQLWSQQSPGVPGVSELGDGFGAALTVGDFDGDGYHDLAIGAPGENIGAISNAGAVTVVRGSALGLRSGGITQWHQDVVGIAESSQTDDEFGAALAAGDFDGDSRDDLAVGIPGESFSAWNEAGAIAVIRGRATGLHVRGDQPWTLASTDLAGDPFHAERLGTVVRSGDFDADGHDDLAAGIPFAHDTTIDNAGSVLAMYGSATGLAAARSTEWTADTASVPGIGEANDRFGATLAVGDADGDGHDDLAIAVLGEETVVDQAEAGEVVVLYGSATGIVATGADTWSQGSVGVPETSEMLDWFGASFAMGDWEGNGFDDLAVGTNESFDGIAFAGSLHGFYGSATGLVSGLSFVWYRSTLGGTNQPEAWFAS